MKVVNAEWEIRNLGVKTIEISIEKKDASLSDKDLLQAIEDSRLQYDAKYVVVKADTQYSQISLALQGAGFFLIENQIEIKANRKDVLLALEKHRQICEGASYRIATDDDIKLVLAEMENGIFSTDRIALDPHFGIKLANQRYSLWLKDELARGSMLCLTSYNGKTLGFSLYKKIGDNVMDNVLGGLFNHPETRFLGANIYSTYANKSYFCDSGAEIFKTAVSANNLPILQLHTKFGCSITNIKNVLIKHYAEEN